MSKQMFFVDENEKPYPEVKNESLGAIAERVTRKNKNNFSERNLTISGELGLIDQLDYFTKNISSKDNSGYYLLEKGEFAYNKSYSKYSPAGATKKLHRYDFGAVSPLYICFRLIPERAAYPEYLEHFFETPMWGKELMSIAVEGARNHGLLNVSVSDFFTLRVPLPSLPEQQKIAEFFSALDERIALTADKVKLLKEQKAGYLQKVFSRELVFTDDNGDRFVEWEQLKVEDIFDVTRGQVIAKPSLSPLQTGKTPYPVYSSQTSNKGILGWSDSYDFEGNYLTWTTDGAHAGRVFSREGKFRCTNVCGVLVEKEKTIGFANFALSEMLNVAASKYVMRGLGNPKLMNDVMRKVPVSIPSLPEQEKIAEFFSALDEQIELTEDKLTLLKEQKKGYLQGIFG